MTTTGACRTAFDKAVAKKAFVRAGLSTPASVTLPKEAFHDPGPSRSPPGSPNASACRCS
ncbi:hypothetical protein [Streptomyces katsurahamanus]|uniref:hypothetical protein n=1 Tax=Streptomyces katsurahamanus TaxID=2577098 RepID=UPI001E54B8B4|nr:hypothetical protein [Streptomyces katsurahamanus]